MSSSSTNKPTKIDKDKVYYGVPVEPHTFDAEKHYYPKVLNANLHSMASSFMSLTNERILARYCHLRPYADYDELLRLMKYEAKYFRWAGADLFCVTNDEGFRRMVVIETNSCPSGQKSMPFSSEDGEGAGYATLMREAFLPLIKGEEKSGDADTDGVLAVVYDKNPMEASGYAAELATLSNERVYMVQFYDHDKDPPVRWDDEGQCSIRSKEGTWMKARAIFRYVTQKPWNRIPIITKTPVLNPVLSCLSGGRNKAVASKAYEIFNAEVKRKTGVTINTPETIKDVKFNEIPLWVRSMGGCAVIKVPYSNAGQGVYTITNKAELDEFMAQDYAYDNFIVQSLVGNSAWSSSSRDGTFFHVGTIPNKKNNSYVCDIRMMVCRGDNGYKPLCIYARRALKPLQATLDKDATDSWDMLGTNLSGKDEEGNWTSDTNRLLLMDSRDFNKLGISIDDLIEGYVQTVLAAIAIDKMAKRLVSEDGSFNAELFRSLNDDQSLIDEILEFKRMEEKKAKAEAKE